MEEKQTILPHDDDSFSEEKDICANDAYLRKLARKSLEDYREKRIKSSNVNDVCFSENFAIGFEEGFIEGYKEGYTKGRLKILRKIIPSLVSSGLSAEQISDEFEISIDEVRTILAAS